MDRKKKAAPITKSKVSSLWSWAEPETVLTVLPRSKSARLAKQAELANVDAERALARAYRAELLRAKSIAEAMFKSGKALRLTFASSFRTSLLYTELARRRFEPGYRSGTDQ